MIYRPRSKAQNVRKLAKLCRQYPSERRAELMRLFAQYNDYRGEPGGWIYGPVNAEGERKRLMQGWSHFCEDTRLLTLAVSWVLQTGGTAFPDLQALLDAAGGYRPTLRPDIDWRFLIVAEVYNQRQAGRGDPRRAYTPGFDLLADGRVRWHDEPVSEAA